MSRQLPEKPNLEHLKKQAKDLLRVLQRGDAAPESPKLADAQHLIAREYGFANWAKLKEHVESVARLLAPAENAVGGGLRQRCGQDRAGAGKPSGVEGAAQRAHGQLRKFRHAAAAGGRAEKRPEDDRCAAGGRRGYQRAKPMVGGGRRRSG